MEKELTAHEHEMLYASVECKVKDWSPALRLNQGEIDEMIEKGIDYAYENLVNYNPKQSKLPTYVAYITSRNLPKWVRDMRNRIRLHHDVKHCEQLSRRGQASERQIRMRTFLLVSNEMSGLSKSLFELHMCMKRKDGSWRGVHEIINLVREAASLEPMAWSTFRDGMLKKCREEFIRAWRKSFCEKSYIWENDL